MYSTRTRVHVRIPNGLPRVDPRTEVGEDVRVGVGVGPIEFQLIYGLIASVNTRLVESCGNGDQRRGLRDHELV